MGPNQKHFGLTSRAVVIQLQLCRVVSHLQAASAIPAAGMTQSDSKPYMQVAHTDALHSTNGAHLGASSSLTHQSPSARDDFAPKDSQHPCQHEQFNTNNSTFFLQNVSWTWPSRQPGFSSVTQNRRIAKELQSSTITWNPRSARFLAGDVLSQEPPFQPSAPITTFYNQLCDRGCLVSCAPCNDLCGACDACNPVASGPFGNAKWCGSKIQARLDAGQHNLLWVLFSNGVHAKATPSGASFDIDGGCHLLCYEIWASRSSNFTTYESFTISGEAIWPLYGLDRSLVFFKVRTVSIASHAATVTHSLWSNTVWRGAPLSATSTSHILVWSSPIGIRKEGHHVQASLEFGVSSMEPIGGSGALVASWLQPAIAAMLLLPKVQIQILNISVAAGGYTANTQSGLTSSTLYAVYDVQCFTVEQCQLVMARAQDVRYDNSVRQRFVTTFDTGAMHLNIIDGSAILGNVLSEDLKSTSPFNPGLEVEAQSSNLNSGTQKLGWWWYVFAILAVAACIAITVPCALLNRASSKTTRGVKLENLKSLAESSQDAEVNFESPEVGRAPSGQGFDPKCFVPEDYMSSSRQSQQLPTTISGSTAFSFSSCSDSVQSSHRVYSALPTNERSACSTAASACSAIPLTQSASRMHHPVQMVAGQPHSHHVPRLHLNRSQMAR